MQPSTTANSVYKFSEVYFGKTLAEHIRDAHKLLSIELKWKYSELVPGQFGYDNMAVSLGYALMFMPDSGSAARQVDSKLSIDDIAARIHDGWVINYVFWRDNKPFENSKLYKKPASPLGDERRNKCAQTKFADLPKDEKDKDRIIARYLHAFQTGSKK